MVRSIAVIWQGTIFLKQYAQVSNQKQDQKNVTKTMTFSSDLDM
jgi:hypothetical protein